MKANRSLAAMMAVRIWSDFKSLTVSGFVQTMRIFASSNDTVLVEGVWAGDRVRGRVWELAQTNAALCRAKNITCEFYGGPPGNRQYYRGTLLTMLMDRAMACTIVEGEQAFVKLFPEKAPSLILGV